MLEIIVYLFYEEEECATTEWNYDNNKLLLPSHHLSSYHNYSLSVVVMADISLKRLRKEFRDIRKNPPAYIRAAPLEKNILEWHYVIEGVKGSPYEHGWYHGKK